MAKKINTSSDRALNMPPERKALPAPRALPVPMMLGLVAHRPYTVEEVREMMAHRPLRPSFVNNLRART